MVLPAAMAMMAVIAMQAALVSSQECGAATANNASCLSMLGKSACCSIYGYCGNTLEYCAPDLCQSECQTKPAVCGDFICNGMETCSSCPFDCGPCVVSASPFYRACDPAVGPGKYALSFDDGPTFVNNVSNHLLDILKAEQVPAVFFSIGNRFREVQGSSMSLRALAEGHLVLSHTYTHPNLSAVADTNRVRQEMSWADVMLRRLTCRRDLRFMRTPYGEGDEATAKVLGDMGFLVAL